MQRRWFVRTATLALAAGLAAAPASVAAAASDASPTSASGWYLALGDSLAAGYQPFQGEDRDGGYVGPVLSEIRDTSPKTKLVNLACSGATSTTMRQGGDRCSYEEGTQLAQAVEFLHAHRKYTRLVTLDIGANDVAHCVRGLDIDYGCLNAGLGAVAVNLPAIVSQLRAAGGPDVHIVVLNYYNPVLAAWLAGFTGQELAQTSATFQSMLNGSIAGAASASAADLADVAAAFDSLNWTPVVTDDWGTLPTNVAHICEWTWMCVLQDIHANDEGYAVLAGAVAADLP
jgi:lysophospholipase L1-like esterase